MPDNAGPKPDIALPHVVQLHEISDGSAGGKALGLSRLVAATANSWKTNQRTSFFLSGVFPFHGTSRGSKKRTSISHFFRDRYQQLARC